MTLANYDRIFMDQYQHVAGIDEAGRGAWAGPVVAAAVILPPNIVIEGVNDSKKLTSKKRDELFEQIKSMALTYGVGMIDSKTIDQINILEATKKAMIMAVKSMSINPAYLMIDGNITLDLPILQKGIIDGDAQSQCIAAASIIAKVTRDRMMMALAKEYPDYGFEKHKGYGTKVHQEALKEKGCLSFHRLTYKPVKAIYNLTQTTQ